MNTVSIVLLLISITALSLAIIATVIAIMGSKKAGPTGKTGPIGKTGPSGKTGPLPAFCDYNKCEYKNFEEFKDRPDEKGQLFRPVCSPMAYNGEIDKQSDCADGQVCVSGGCTLRCNEDSDCKGIWGGSLKSSDNKLQLVCQNYGVGAGASKPKYCQIVPNPRSPPTPYSVDEMKARCTAIGLTGEPVPSIPDDFCFSPPT